MDDCTNYKNLRACGQCKNASYCSVDCQSGAHSFVPVARALISRLVEKNWNHHKLTCTYNVTQFALAHGENIFQRNLRHWVVRFDATLVSACLRGLNLKYEWDRINRDTLLIFLEPGPHPNVDSVIFGKHNLRRTTSIGTSNDQNVQFNSSYDDFDGAVAAGAGARLKAKVDWLGEPRAAIPSSGSLDLDSQYTTI
ncbi:hypothetical protein B0H13DRAFT_2305505 [Mycena leptocephala]|nr:hypothetical protein B0H13DRAFT_2305505 [Mycena leptocephala]